MEGVCAPLVPAGSSCLCRGRCKASQLLQDRPAPRPRHPAMLSLLGPLLCRARWSLIQLRTRGTERARGAWDSEVREEPPPGRQCCGQRPWEPGPGTRGEREAEGGPRGPSWRQGADFLPKQRGAGGAGPAVEAGGSAVSLRALGTGTHCGVGKGRATQEAAPPPPRRQPGADGAQRGPGRGICLRDREPWAGPGVSPPPRT